MGDSSVPEPLALRRFRTLCSGLSKSAEQVTGTISREPAYYISNAAVKPDSETFFGIVRRAFESIERAMRNLERVLNEVGSMDFESVTEIQLEASVLLIGDAVRDIQGLRGQIWLLSPPTEAHRPIRESVIRIIDVLLLEFSRFAQDCTSALKLAEASVAGTLADEDTPSHVSLVFNPDTTEAMAEFEKASRQFHLAHGTKDADYAEVDHQSVRGGEPMNPLVVFVLVVVMGMFCLLFVR